MDFYALIEEWSDPDESIVFFRELPGCFVTTPTPPEAIQKAPGAIADWDVVAGSTLPLRPISEKLPGQGCENE